MDQIQSPSQYFHTESLVILSLVNDMVWTAKKNDIIPI